jgi:hypothetical protein
MRWLSAPEFAAPSWHWGVDPDSVVNVSQVLTIDRAIHLDDQVAGEPPMPL